MFEYIPSRFSLADELASKQRVESEAKRMAVSVGPWRRPFSLVLKECLSKKIAHSMQGRSAL